MKYQIVKRIFGISLAVCTIYGSVRGAYATVMSGMYATANNSYMESESTYTVDAAPDAVAVPDTVAASDTVVASDTVGASEAIDSTLTPSDDSSAVSESEEHIAAAEQEEKKEAVLNDSNSEEQEEILPESEPEEPEISLEEYLSSLVCGACGRKCSLLHPHCRNGKHKARSAEQQYYEIYSVS